MKLSPAVFWRMSWKEFTLSQRGFFEMEETKMRTTWEIARWQAYISALPYAKRGQLPNPKALMRFPWEEEDKIEFFTEDERDYFIRKFGKFERDGNFVN